MIVEKIEKNGNFTVKYVWSVDESTPKVWLDGSTYKFNSTLLKTVIIANNRNK